MATYHPLWGETIIRKPTQKIVAKKSVYTHDYRVFLRLLRRLRSDAGLSQEEVAAKIGRTQSFIGKCERGERRLDVIELQAFCGAIGVSLSDFARQLEKAQKMPLEKLRKYLGDEWP
jgi:transcriptional regulator with XRE-family HTH domain